MGSRYDVVLDGQGLLIRQGSYRRWREGGRAKVWRQEDWRGGCGYLTPGPFPTREGGRWYRGECVDVSVEGRLALGWGWNDPLAVGSQGSLVAMMPFGAYLYGIADGESKVRQSQPAGWLEQYALPTGAAKCLGTAFGELMVGSSDGKIHSYDPYAGVWGLRYERAAGRPVTALAGCSVYDGTIHCSVPRLAVGLSRATNGGPAVVEVLSSDGVLEQSLDCGEPVVSAMCEYRGRLFVATGWAESGVGGKLLAWDGNSAGRLGEMVEVARFSDGSVSSMGVGDGLLWLGMTNGRILASDGEHVATGLDLVGLGYLPGPVRGVMEYGGRVFAGYGGAGRGACVLRRCASAESGAGSGVGGAAEGWSVFTSSGGEGEVVTAMAPHEGGVYVALSTSAGPVSRRLNLGGYVREGEIVLGPVTDEDPGVDRAMRRLKVGTDPMPYGCEVDVFFSKAAPTGPWTYLGHHAYMNQPYVDMYFDRYEWGHEYWLRLVLKGNGISTPRVRWVEVEYGERPWWRTWELEARCEGSPTLPLLLKDNSLEEKEGWRLSSDAWLSGESEPIDFEDVDGQTYQVRVERIEDVLDGLPQEYGGQSLVKVRLVQVQ